MSSHLVKSCLIGAVMVFINSALLADVPGGVLPLLPAEKAIAEAASLRDPAEREAAVREAIRKGLLETEPRVANEVFGYLSKNIRWLDLRPYVDLLEAYAKVDHWQDRGLGLADHAEIFRAPRDERLRVYAAAIVEGETTLKRGTPLLRQTAMLLAADDGLAELKPVIETYYPEESAEVRRDLPLPELLTRLELGAGAVDREDANRLASERLAAMKDDEFRERMDTHAAFRKVVEDISSYVCVPDPYLVRRNPGCASIKAIVKRQLELEAKAKQVTSLGAGESTRPPQSLAERLGTWLGKMQECSKGELGPKQTP